MIANNKKYFFFILQKKIYIIKNMGFILRLILNDIFIYPALKKIHNLSIILFNFC